MVYRKRLTKKGLLDQLPDPKNPMSHIRHNNHNNPRGHSSDRENNVNGGPGQININKFPRNNFKNNRNHKQNIGFQHFNGNFRGNSSNRRRGNTPNRRNNGYNRGNNKRKASNDMENNEHQHKKGGKTTPTTDSNFNLPSIDEQLNTTNDSFENLEIIPNYTPSDGVNIPPLSSSAMASRRLRASSPTPSTWSLSTTATFKHDLRDSQFQDMVETFRENDLNNATVLKKIERNRV